MHRRMQHFLSRQFMIQVGNFISQFPLGHLQNLLSKYTPTFAVPFLLNKVEYCPLSLPTTSPYTTPPFTLNATLAEPPPAMILHNNGTSTPTLTLIQPVRYAVQLSGVSKSFPHHQSNNPLHRHAILKDISLDITPGETVVLLGPSGCGKSTLLRLLNGLEKPDNGEITVNGIPLHQLPKGFSWSAFRAEVGMVFQQYNLFPHMTVLKNIMLGATHVRKLSKKEAHLLCMDLLASVGLADKAHCYPYQLSGGEKQRIAIARALALAPQILLLDEPTSALDPVMTNDVLLLIKTLTHHGVTLVIVTHEVGFAADVADRIIFMHEGELIFDDTPKSFLEMPDKPQIIETYLSNTLFKP